MCIFVYLVYNANQTQGRKRHILFQIPRIQAYGDFFTKRTKKNGAHKQHSSIKIYRSNKKQVLTFTENGKVTKNRKTI